MTVGVKFFPRSPRAVLKPCPARATGPILGSDATFLSCAERKGHDGPHWFHVEWGPGAGAPSEDQQ